jgi:2',3'-cyclic-nucleotide 2'-phosphodiesterase/3'-nucleotidase
VRFRSIVRLRVPILLLAAARALPAQDTAHVVLVATTDVHGHVTAWDYVQDRPAPWGLVRAAAVVDSLRGAYPGAVVLVDAGDLLQGNPFATYFATVRPRLVNPIIEALNTMRYDAAVPGNHDFDFGLEVLGRAYEHAAFPVVAANVIRTDRDTTAFATHVVLARGGVRVGIIGLTTPGVTVWNRRRLGDRFRVRRIAADAAPAVERVRAAGADLVVAVVHAGLAGASSYDTTGVGPEDDAAALTRIAQPPHVLVVGHTHGRIRDSLLNGVRVVQPQPLARSVSVVHVWLLRGAGGRARVLRTAADEIPLGDVRPDPVLDQHLREAHEEVRNWASLPLAVAEGDWSSREARVRDTPFLDFLNGVQRRRTGADLSAAAAFSTTAALGPGPVRLRDVAGVYPYENTLTAVRIDGARLKQFLEHSARYFHTYAPGRPLIDDSIPGYDFDVVSGVTYGIDLAQPAGSRIRGLAYRGRPVTPADTFTLALNSYRQAGGGGYDMLRGLPVTYDRGEDVRTLIEEALREAETLRAADHFEPSWRLLPPAAEAAALATFAPPLPARDTTVLRVVVTGALRGGFAARTLDGRPIGGLPALAARVDSLRRACGCATFWVDAGGASHGAPLAALSQGALTVAAFNAAGLDASALGAGDAAVIGDDLGQRVAASRFPWTAINAVPADRAATPLRPWVRLERGGRSVVVMGVVDGTPPGGAGRTVARLRVDDPAAAITRALSAVRAANADAVVVLGDFDAACTAPDCGGEALDLARSLDTGVVHAIVGGTAATMVGGTAVAPVLAYGMGVTVVDLVNLAVGGKAARTRVDTVWADRVSPDSAVAAVVAREATALDRALDEAVAELRFTLVGDSAGELPLGRLVADAVRGAGRAQLAIIPSSTIRRGLPGGTLRLRHLFERLPGPSPLTVVTVTGEELVAALDSALAAPALLIHVAGMTVRYDARRRPGQRVREVRLDDGDRLDRRATYRVAVSATLLELAPFAAVREAPAEPLGVTDRAALRRYLGLLRQPVEAPAGDRVVFVR